MTANATKIAFVDTAIADSQKLIASLGSDVEVVLVNGGDGLDEMAEVLKNRSDLDAIMVFSHGEEGKAVIGDAQLSGATLDRYADDLAVIGGSLSETGDLLLYGCNVGAGADGRALVDELAMRTGADVAASNNPTGAAALGGDWDLEVRCGDVAAAPLDTAALRDVSGLLAITSETIFSFKPGDYSKGIGDSIGTIKGLTFSSGSTFGDSYANFQTGSSFYTQNTEDNFNFIYLNASIYNDFWPLILKGYDDGESVPGAYWKGFIHNQNFGTTFFNIDKVVITTASGYSLTTARLTVGPSNTAPAIGNLGGDSLTYDEGSGAVVLDRGTAATVTDSDSANFDTGTLTVFIVSGGYLAEDVLAVRNLGTGAGQIGVSGTTVTYGGTTIGTVSGGSGSDLVVTFNENSSPEAAQALIRNITYENTNTTSPTSHSFKFTLTDGDGGTFTTESVTMSVVDVNDPPMLSATASSPTYVPGGTAATLFSGTDISTAESGQSITSVTLTVGGLADGASEKLVVDGVDVTLTNGASGITTTNHVNYTVSVSAGTATVTLTNTASTATWKTLIDGLQYRNDAANPTTTGGRTVTLTGVTDNGGTANGGVASTSLSIASAVTFAQPAITSATFDWSAGQLTLTGTNFLSFASAANDVLASAFTFTGEGGDSAALSSTANVDITSPTTATITLSTADLLAIRGLLDKDGTTASGGTTYNLAAADDWMAASPSGSDIADATTPITVSGVAAPTITSATYDADTGVLTVTGTNFCGKAGAANDIDVSKLTITGDGGVSYTLTSTSVDATNGTSFTVALNATDQAALRSLLNANGTTSTGGTTYNLAAAEDWAAGAAAAVVVADTTGNGITVSNVPVPTITSATYNALTGVLVVTGMGFLPLAGAAKDIDASKLTITGEGGATYTLTDTADVDITSATSCSLTLSDTDRVAVGALLNKEGTSSVDGSPYNLSAAEDWAAGAAAAVVVADTIGNGITVTLNQPPVITSGGGGATAAVNVAENTTAVTTVTATDADAGDTPTYAVSGGADQALFTINATTGALAFLAAPDFETPADSDTDNVYEVVVSASDGHGGTDTQTLSVTVTDVAEGGGGGGGGGSTDADNDGVSTTVENQVPGLPNDSGTGIVGDGNGDGQPDSQQNDICSVSFLETSTPVSNPQGAPTAYITLVADSLDGKIDTTDDNTAVLENVRQQDAPADKPSDVLMPFGMISFTADVGNAGETETFSLYVDEDVAVNGYWKQTADGSWVNLASEAYGGRIVQEGDKIRLDFSLADGGEFDSDGVADGTISDPGGIGWRDQALVFDEDHYLASKLAQLQASGETAYTTTDQVKAAIEAAGLTCEEHYERYSLAEGTDPDAFFDTDAYLSNKAAQLNSIVYEDRTDWTADEVQTLLAESGFTNAYDHFSQYGWLENVDPSSTFDVSAYLATKANQCNMTVQEVTEVLQQYGLDPISHYALYGQNESGVTVSAVSSS